jgi:YVTN family beta-propeller protein
MDMPGPSVGSTFAGCRIETEAGRGGMGVVYKATQIALDRPVALKAIAPDVALDHAFRERFKSEARLAASIDHPHIVPVYETGELDGQLYLVMRWVDGVDLRALIDREPLEPKRAAKLAAQVASALGAAHAKHLLHRDVKPANVLVATVDDSEHAYLTDFGIAKLEHGGTGLTRTGMMVGTIDYMPPERFEGAPGDARSDIYSLGCVLFEMLTGQPPFVRETEGARIYAHMAADVPSATDTRPAVPSALSEVARRAMAKKPEDRFQTAGEMARAVMTAATPPTVEAESKPPAAVTKAAATVPAAPPPPPPSQETKLRATPAQPPAAPPPAPPPAAQPAPAPAPAQATKRRGPLLAALLGGAALIAVLLVVLMSGGGGDDEGSGGGEQSSAPVGEPIPVPTGPEGLGTGGDTVWVTGSVDGVLARIDAGTGQTIGEPTRVGSDPDSVVIGEDAAWVTNNDGNTVMRIDPATGKVVAEIPIGRSPESIALDPDGAPWVALIEDGGVRRIDPQSNTPDPIVMTGDEPYGLIVDGDTVWVTHRGDGTVAHFPRAGGDVSTVTVAGRPRALAVEGDSLWVVDFEDRLIELDRESGVVRDEIIVEGEPREVIAAEGALWITLYAANQLARFDLESREITTQPAPGGPLGLTAAAGRIWVGAFDGSTVTPFAP